MTKDPIQTESITHQFERSIGAASKLHSARFEESIRELSSSLIFRKDDRTRERFIGDIQRLAHFAGRRRLKQPDGRRALASGSLPEPASCDQGWTGILTPDDIWHRSTSAAVDIPALETEPASTHVGYSGFTKRSLPSARAVSIGAAIGEYCGLGFTPQNQRISLGNLEGTTVSASVYGIANLTSPLKDRAPSALTVKVPLLRNGVEEALLAGAPNEPGGGFIWCWAKASLDVYIGLNLVSAVTKLPHGRDEICLYNRVGFPVSNNPALEWNGLNGDWSTQIESFDDGDISAPTLSVPIGGTGLLSDQIIMVAVTIDVACFRYPGSSAFAGISFHNPTELPGLVTTPNTGLSGPIDSAPIQIGEFRLCGL